MHTVQFLTQLVASHDILAYCLLFIGVLLEGEFTLIIFGILAHIGAVNFGLAIFIGFTGAVLKTVAGYYLGAMIHRKWNGSRFFKHMEKKISYILPKFKQKPFWSIFASKFIVGINHVVLLFAGYLKINFRTYLKAEFLSTIPWVLGLLYLGKFFGFAALGISNEIKIFTLIIVGFIIGFFILEKIISFFYEIFEEFYDND